MGTEKRHKTTHDLWHKAYGLNIFEGYGATEASPALSLNTPMHHRVGTVGQFLPDIAYALRNVSSLGHSKRLHVAGMTLMMGGLLALMTALS